MILDFSPAIWVDKKNNRTFYLLSEEAKFFFKFFGLPKTEIKTLQSPKNN